MTNRATRTLLRCVAVSLAAAAALAVHAGTADLGTVSEVHIFSNGQVIFYTSGTRSNAPGCATQLSRFAFDSSTVGGKSQLSGLLVAYSTGKPIVIYGTGACDIYGDTETLSYYYMP